MEQWEIDYRAELDKMYLPGLYNIGDSSFVVITGKQGKIDFEVEVMRGLRPKELPKGQVRAGGIRDQIKDMPLPSLSNIDWDKFLKDLEDFT